MFRPAFGRADASLVCDGENERRGDAETLAHTISASPRLTVPVSRLTLPLRDLHRVHYRGERVAMFIELVTVG